VVRVHKFSVFAGTFFQGAPFLIRLTFASWAHVSVY
jgi:hypothetical protein